MNEMKKIKNNPEAVEIDKNLEYLKVENQFLDHELEEKENQNQKLLKKIKIIHVK